MDARKLPIRIFEKRQLDERLTEGGGGNKPNWVMSGADLIEHCESLTPTLDSVDELIENRIERGVFLPAVVNIQLDDKAIAKTHRGEVGKLFDVNNKKSTIGFSDSSTLLLKIDKKEDLAEIRKNFEKTEKNAHGLSAIDEISVFSPFIEIEDKKMLKVKLMDYQDYEYNRIVNELFENLCSEHQIEFKKKNYGSGITVYRIDNLNDESIDTITSFDGVFSVEDMPQYELSSDAVEGDSPEVEIKSPIDGADYPVVGVLDSGVSKIGHIEPWLTDEKHTNYIEEDIDPAHGTMVASILLYGDELEGQDFIGHKGCKIFDATIAPKQAVLRYTPEDELIENIAEAISNNPDIKIWQLSVGTSKEADWKQFSDFGAALDELQERHGVLICKSAGNCNNFKQHRPKSRISKSADSVRSLVVGSIAHRKEENDISEVDESSPFSRIGLAPADIIKPDLVHYGGNAGLNNSGIAEFTGVKSFNKDGGIVDTVGTSFSTPRISSLVAGLHHEIDESFDSLLLKALTIHSAKYPEVLQELSPEDKAKQVGFGKPTKIEEIIYNNPDEITLILQDSLEQGKFIEILDFPFPDLVDDEGYFYGEIIVTLVSSPILEQSQGVEYCQSNIDVFFGTYDEKVERNMESKTVRNPVGKDTDSSVNLLKSSLYSKKMMKAPGPFSSERMLLNFSKKYQPVKKWAINLEEVNPSPKENFLKAPKKWFLKLEGLYRHFAESKYDDLSQDFCLIITIRDNKGNNEVYNKVTQQLEQFNFVQKEIRLREEIRIRT